MTEWETDPQRGLRVGLGIIAAILLVDGGLIAWIASRPISLLTFLVGLWVLLSLGLLALIGYWLNGLLHSVYALDRNALTIVWGGNRHVVPTPLIERVLLGSDLEGRVRFRGIRWPGYWVGYGEIEGVGPAILYATVPPREQVFIVAQGVAYGISPDDVEGFLRTLQTRLQMGPTQRVEPTSEGPAFLEWEFWQDRLGLVLLGGATLGVLVLFGFLSAQFPSLPRLLPLHFDATGAPDRLGPRQQIFFIPIIGLVVLLVNGGLGGLLYRRERVASYLLWGGAGLVQLLLWAAVVGILRAV
ncbi:MAG TPA: DUF1648 domain-containing protein [Anaerolineae bacterium]|nr:DUF1648 domain-containing protein [Anaerolineae bacterium]